MEQFASEFRRQPMAIILGLLVLWFALYFVWKNRPSRESVRRRRDAKLGISDALYERVEERALDLVSELIGCATWRLQRSAAELALGLPEATVPSVSSLIPNPALDLAATSANLAQLQSVCSALDGAVTAHEHPHPHLSAEGRAVLAHRREALESHATLSTPLLAWPCQQRDAATLATWSKLPVETLGAELRESCEFQLAELTELGRALRAQRLLIWSLLDLVVLSVSSLADLNETEQRAVGGRTDPHRIDPTHALVRARLHWASNLAHGTSPTDRVRGPNGLQLPLRTLEFGEHVTQQRAAAAVQEGPMRQAEVLSQGDASLLWLAHAVLTHCAYPAEAISAFAQARRWLRDRLELPAGLPDDLVRALTTGAAQLDSGSSDLELLLCQIGEAPAPLDD